MVPVLKAVNKPLISIKAVKNINTVQLPDMKAVALRIRLTLKSDINLLKLGKTCDTW